MIKCETPIGLLPVTRLRRPTLATKEFRPMLIESTSSMNSKSLIIQLDYIRLIAVGLVRLARYNRYLTSYS